MLKSTKPGKKTSRRRTAAFSPKKMNLIRKTDKTVDAILLLDAATSSDRKTYLNLVTTIVSLTYEISSANNNIVTELQENVCL